MSKAARTIQVWSFYVLGLGLILMIVPNFLLSMFGFPTTDEVWIRVVGVLALLLAYYYYNASKLEMTELFRWSVNGRIPIIIVFIIFVLLQLAPPQLILFGAVDLAGALWTRAALRE
jgi:glycopeptide antibiotics resistance protein